MIFRKNPLIRAARLRSRVEIPAKTCPALRLDPDTTNYCPAARIDAQKAMVIYAGARVSPSWPSHRRFFHRSRTTSLPITSSTSATTTCSFLDFRSAAARSLQTKRALASSWSPTSCTCVGQPGYSALLSSAAGQGVGVQQRIAPSPRICVLRVSSLCKKLGNPMGLPGGAAGATQSLRHLQLLDFKLQ